jgi:Uma2 family endonuclease
MSTGLKLSFQEYSRLVERGLFDELRDRRIELIYGELREMPAPGPSHSEIVDRLAEWSLDRAPRQQVRVRIQNPLGIPRLDSAPVPDLAWVHRGDYSRRHPLPQETLLLIEVSDSTLAYDLGEKAGLYARAGIREYWVVDVQGYSVVIHREPAGSQFADVCTYGLDDSVMPLAFPDLSLVVKDLFSSP